MPKIHFIVRYFIEVLHFKESYNLIDQQYFSRKLENQSFVTYGTGSEITITISVFTLNNFQEK